MKKFLKENISRIAAAIILLLLCLFWIQPLISTISNSHDTQVNSSNISFHESRIPTCTPSPTPIPSLEDSNIITYLEKEVCDIFGEEYFNSLELRNNTVVINVRSWDMESAEEQYDCDLLLMNKVLKNLSIIDNLSVLFTFETTFKDIYGQTYNETSLTAKYSKNTINKIQFDNYDYKDLDFIADDFSCHDVYTEYINNN